MKRTQYWILAPILGAVAMVCRLLLFTGSTDSRGLLIPGSLPELLLTGLCLLALPCALFAQEPTLRKDGRLSAISHLLFAVALCLPQGGRVSVTPVLWLLFRWSAYASAAALCALALLRFRGQKPPFGLNALVCIGLMIRLVASYQIWSHMPQMQNYVLSLFGALLLTGFSYQQTAREVGLGSATWRLRLGLLGSFFCLSASLPGQPFYFLAGLWMLGCVLFDPKEEPRDKNRPIP